MKFLVEDGQKRYEIPLREGHTVIGRDTSCDVTIQHGQMSRKHMLCVVQGQTVEVQDLGSKNGIYVGPTRISRMVIQPGTTLRIGDLRMTLFAEPMEGALGQSAALPSTPQPPPATVTDVEAEVDEPTPADDTFIPQPYSPAPTGSPQLVARGDKWFVHDAASGREIEIVPVPPGGQMQAPVPYVPAPSKPSPFLKAAQWFQELGLRRQIMFVIAIMLLLGLGMWAAIELSKKPPPPKKMTRQEYADLVDKSVVALEKDDVETAKKYIQRAIKGMPSRKIAPALKDLAEIWHSLKTEFSPVRQEAENVLEEIAESDHATSKARTMALRQIQWMRKEAFNEGCVFDARRYAQQNRWADAATKFDQILADSIFRKTYAKQIQEAHEKALQQFLAAGKKAVDEHNWDEAIEHFKSAIRFAGGKLPEAEKMIQYCKRCRHVQDGLARARKAFNKGDTEQAVRLLAQLETGTPFDHQIQSLRNQAESQKEYGDAMRTFQRGDGKKAIEMLRRLHTPAASQAIDRIMQVLKHLDEAEKAVASDDFRVAATHWQQVAQLASEKGNWYGSQAQAHLAAWKDIAKAKAQKYVNDGDKFLRSGNYPEARLAYEKARSIDPDQEIGTAQLQDMQRRAQELYNAGLNLQKIDPKKALEKFRAVKEFLGPNSKYFQNADERIRQIEAGQ